MQSKILSDDTAGKTYVLVLDRGEEAAAGLLEFARQQGLTAASFTALGALKDVTLGWFNVEKKDYEKIPINEQVEVLAMIGNVAVYEGEPKVHAHLVVGKRDGTAHGGHLLEAHVRPTLEVTLTETPQHLRRKIDDRTGLPLIAPDESALPPRRGRPVESASG